MILIILLMLQSKMFMYTTLFWIRITLLNYLEELTQLLLVMVLKVKLLDINTLVQKKL